MVPSKTITVININKIEQKEIRRPHDYTYPQRPAQAYFIEIPRPERDKKHIKKGEKEIIDNHFICLEVKYLIQKNRQIKPQEGPGGIKDHPGRGNGDKTARHPAA
jgi:hypothetical protein